MIDMHERNNVDIRDLFAENCTIFRMESCYTEEKLIDIFW